MAASASLPRLITTLQTSTSILVNHQTHKQWQRMCLYEGGVGGGEFETELTRREKEKSEDEKEMKWC